MTRQTTRQLYGTFFPVQSEKITTEKKRYSRLANGGGSDLKGTLRPEKNAQLSGWLCFSAGANYNRKKLRPEIKGTVESSDRPFFPAGSNFNQKNYDWKNKRYSHLADGGGSGLAGTLRPEKNNVQSSGRLCFSAGSNYNWKKFRPKKKAPPSGSQLETGKYHVWKKRYEINPNIG